MVTKTRKNRNKDNFQNFHVVTKQKASDVPTMVTINELSEKTGVSTFAIRKMVKNNKIVYVTIGKKVLINYEKFLQYLNTGEEKAGGETQ